MSPARLHPLERLAHCRQALVLRELRGLQALRREAARLTREAGAQRAEAERVRLLARRAREADRPGGSAARLALASAWRLRCEREERAAGEAVGRAAEAAREAEERLAREVRRLALRLEEPRRLAERGAGLRRTEARRRQERSA